MARAMQHRSERSGVPSGVLCSTVMDFQRYMEPLMCLKGYDVLEASLLKATDKEAMASPDPCRRDPTVEEPDPQKAHASIPHIPAQPEQAFKPDDAVRLGVITTDPWIFSNKYHHCHWVLDCPHWCLGPPILEDAEPLVHNPREAQLDIISLASMEEIMTRNALMGKFKCHYQMLLISMTSLQLNPSEAQG